MAKARCANCGRRAALDASPITGFGYCAQCAKSEQARLYPSAAQALGLARLAIAPD